MKEMNILQYFNANASKEEWKLVQDVYNRELVELLKELGMEGKKEFNLAELSVIYTRTCLGRDLDAELMYEEEYGCGGNENAKNVIIEIGNGNGNINLYIEKLNEELAKIIS